MTSTRPSMRAMFKWGRDAIRGIELAFIGVALLAIATNTVGQFSVALIGSLGAPGTAASANSAPATPPVAARPALAGSEQTRSVRRCAPGGQGDGAASGANFMGGLVPQTLNGKLVLFTVVALLAIALAYANRTSGVWLNAIMLRRLQQRLHDKLLAFGPAYHARHDLGENSSLVLQYAAATQPMLRDVLSSPVRFVSICTALFFLYESFRTQLSDPCQADQAKTLLYMLFAALAVVPIVAARLSSKVRDSYLAVRNNQAKLSSALIDSLTAPAEVQLMNAQQSRSVAFAERLRALARSQVRAALGSEMANQFQNAIPVVLQIAFVWYALGTGGAAGVQAAITSFLLIPRVVQPIQETMQFRAAMNMVWPQVELVGTILDQRADLEDGGTRSAAGLEHFNVALEDIAFRLSPDRNILNGINFEFKQGEITALVGLSGSGKSTVLRLISRLFDPDEGRVTIGGVDVRDFKLQELRSLVASVSQFPLFIEGTVRENMLLAAPNASAAQMEDACRRANLWHALEIASPGDPLGTAVPRTAGKSGLAGGERRRLAIARTLLCNPRVLLLDEPAAGIDAQSVTIIAGELRHAAVGRTVVLVEHDVDLIRSVADRICCLENGKITDSGTPDELLRRQSLFKQLIDQRRSYSALSQVEIDQSVPVRKLAKAEAAGKPQLNGIGV